MRELTIEPTQLGEDVRPPLIQRVATPEVRAWLAAQQGRVRFAFVPLHASWLNQIEIRFSLKFEGGEACPCRIIAFLDTGSMVVEEIRESVGKPSGGSRKR